MSYVNISEEDLEYIRQNYPNVPTREIAEKLGVTTNTIQKRAQAMGIKKNKKNHEKTAKTKEYIKANYPKMDFGTMAKELGLSAVTVKSHAIDMGLYVSERRSPEPPKPHRPKRHVFIPGKKYLIKSPNVKGMDEHMKGYSTDRYIYLYDTDVLHFFKNKFGRMESFQMSRIGVDVFVREA